MKIDEPKTPYHEEMQEEFEEAIVEETPDLDQSLKQAELNKISVVPILLHVRLNIKSWIWMLWMLDWRRT